MTTGVGHSTGFHARGGWTARKEWGQRATRRWRQWILQRPSNAWFSSGAQLRAAVSRSRRCALAAVQRPFRGCSGSIHARPEIGAAWQRELCPSLVATKRECLPACQPALDFRPASIITARRILFQTASLSASRQHSARPAQSRSMLVCNRDGRRVARISWYTLMRLSER
ncbi:hypothetical protein VFPBJ_01236 [Purpureocillium lilacinum]|uniref:Uncharacterized protein n=1 Tax=Purpureocillium lilacinum TaxID=33203 RepID=A0A179HA85_PURLI|nr:hypothetical protein VFPBJ_01236 [Purpureocillium lilacinum]